MKRTILTKLEQATWCDKHHTTLTHKWSCRGYGNSKIIHASDVIAKASGCGYDRYGAALGNAIEALFQTELDKLAKRECSKPYAYGGKHKSSANIYGLFYDTKKQRAYVDGGCGHDCMERILNRIGFSLEWIGDTGNKGQTGEVFYKLTPLNKRDRDYMR